MTDESLRAFAEAFRTMYETWDAEKQKTMIAWRLTRKSRKEHEDFQRWLKEYEKQKHAFANALSAFVTELNDDS